MKLHPIPPGMFCVPSALAALTGADPASVIIPSINRNGRRANALLFDTITSLAMPVAEDVLRELSFRVRRFKNRADLKLRVHLTTWAARSVERYPGEALLVATATHALVVQDGRVYDTFTPHGELAGRHSYAKSTVVYAVVVDKP